jgi:hypothetical protein
MATLTWTKRDGTQFLIQVSDEDVEYLSQWNWHVTQSGYAARRTKGQPIVWMHRVVLERMGFPPGSYECADHINRDRLDNRRDNLRPATFALNAQNREHGRKGAPRVLPDPDPRPCAACGDLFIPRRKSANLAKAKFCSRDCQRGATFIHTSERQSERAKRRWALQGGDAL